MPVAMRRRNPPRWKWRTTRAESLGRRRPLCFFYKRGCKAGGPHLPDRLVDTFHPPGPPCQREDTVVCGSAAFWLVRTVSSL